jgi:hypothetical protein
MNEKTFAIILGKMYARAGVGYVRGTWIKDDPAD